MKKVYKFSSYFLSLLIILSMGITNVFAAPEEDNSGGHELVDEQLVVTCSDQLTVEEMDFLLEDPDFLAQYQKLIAEGWELESVEIRDVMPFDSGVSVYSDGTRYVGNGKIVESSYIQPQRTTKKYNNTLYNVASDIGRMIKVAVNVIPVKYSWIASTLFSIPTGDFAACFDNGTQNIITDRTLHNKMVFYKGPNDTRYYSGISTFMEYVTVTIVSSYHDSNNNPYHETGTRSKAYSATNYYYPDADLVHLAELYYNQGGKEYDIEYSGDLLIW